jgi:hypothetical protein
MNDEDLFPSGIVDVDAITWGEGLPFRTKSAHKLGSEPSPLPAPLGRLLPGCATKSIRSAGAGTVRGGGSQKKSDMVQSADVRPASGSTQAAFRFRRTFGDLALRFDGRNEPDAVACPELKAAITIKSISMKNALLIGTASFGKSANACALTESPFAS